MQIKIPFIPRQIGAAWPTDGEVRYELHIYPPYDEELEQGELIVMIVDNEVKKLALVEVTYDQSTFTKHYWGWPLT